MNKGEFSISVKCLAHCEELLADELKELGLVVCRGTAVLLISPLNGTEEIANPFAAA